MDIAWFISVVFTSLALSALLVLLLLWRYRKELSEHRQTTEAVKQARTELECLQEEITNATSRLTDSRAELATVESRTAELVELEKRATEIREFVETGSASKVALEKEIEERKSEREELDGTLHDLKSDLDLYTRVADFVDFGHFEEPEYLHETAARYTEEIKRTRARQKDMIKSGEAVELPDDIAVDGSSQKGSQILAGQAKMLLKAFDIECDLLIGKTTPSNFSRTLERIEKIADALEKMALSLMCGFTTDYVELKYEECRLVYEYKLKKAAEDEEQRAIREQMREEQKAIREYERALAEAEKEEKLYQRLLEKAKEQLQASSDETRAEFEAKVRLLEEQLQEAREKGERAQSLAEQTRRGHVYVISNIGSFGDDVFKIGLTRRLDPMERVKELGDASVPFPFDVHAIIYSEDAPALEASLHKKFDGVRLNAVNRRKEFFRVSLSEIKFTVEDLYGDDADFKTTVLAEQYYETLRLQGGEAQAA